MRKSDIGAEMKVEVEEMVREAFSIIQSFGEKNKIPSFLKSTGTQNLFEYPKGPGERFPSTPIL